MEKLTYLVYVVQIVSCMIPFLGIAILMVKEVTRTSQRLMMACVGSFIMNTGYIMMLTAETLSEAMLSYKIELAGNVIFYFFFMNFVETYIHMRPPRVVYYLWALAGAMNVLVFWVVENPVLIMRKVSFIVLPKMQIRQVEIVEGPIWNARTILFILLSIHLMVSCAVRIKKRNTELAKGSLIKLVCALGLILLAAVLNYVKTPILNTFPFLSAVALIIITAGVLRGDFYSVTDEGRDWIVEHMDSIVVMVDDTYGFLEANEEAKRVIPQLATLRRNEPIPEELKELYLTEDEKEHFGDHFYNKKVMKIEQKGRVKGYALMLIDQTHLYFLIDQWKEEKERANQASEAKSLFISGISHELRTPLNAIVGIAEILLRKNLEENEREYLKNIKRSGMGLLNIINEILDFSKLESGKGQIIEEEYNLVEMFRDLSMMFLNRLGTSKIELYYDIDERMPSYFWGDSMKIRQTIINIVTNAIKYTESGYVRVAIHGDMCTDNEDVQEIMLTVEDTGIGIAEEDLPKLFQSFERADIKRNYHREGSGLGLSISKQMVELMGGTIEAESEYGKGSTFTVRLKQKVTKKEYYATLKEETGTIALCFRDEHRQKQAEELAAFYGRDWVKKEKIECSLKNISHILTDCIELFEMGEINRFQERGIKVCHFVNPMIDFIPGKGTLLVNLPLCSYSFCQALNGISGEGKETDEIVNFKASNARVLVVDDSEVNLNVAKGLLNAFGIQADTVLNGKEAVDKVKEKTYDLVFMDHMMPVMDGVEAVRIIRQDYTSSELPIIGLTANVLPEAQEEMTAAGMNAILHKPIPMKDLAEALLYWLPSDKLEFEMGNLIAEEEDESKEIFHISGLSEKEGMENCRTREIFEKSLVDFYRVIDLKIEKIRECLENGDIAGYTVEVHGLKSSSRMIGAIELSQKFAKLEVYGRNKDMKQIERCTEQVISSFLELKAALKEIAGKKEEGKKDVSCEQKIETLKRLESAIDQFDLDEADEAMRQLESYIFEEEIQEKIELLQAHVADVAMEEILSLTAEITSYLEERV